MSHVGNCGLSELEHMISLTELERSDSKDEERVDIPTIQKGKKECSDIRKCLDQQAPDLFKELNYVEKLDQLIKKVGFTAGLFEKNGNSALHKIIERNAENDLLLIKLYVYLAPSLLNHPSSNKTLPIHVAAVTGQKEMLSFLLDPSEVTKESKTDINAATEDGLTPLHHAVIEGHQQVAHFLKEKGADIDAEDMVGLTAADWAHFTLHTFDEKRKETIFKIPELNQKYQSMMKEFKPSKRAVYSLNEILERITKGMKKSGLLK